MIPVLANQRILILAYGNPGRQDDGLGPAAAEAIQKLGLPGVTVEISYQLNIEDAADVAEHDGVLFLDAAENGLAPFAVRVVEPANEIAFTSHIVKPESILAICREHFGRTPRGWLIAIRGYEFELQEGLTDAAKTNLLCAIKYVLSRLRDQL